MTIDYNFYEPPDVMHIYYETNLIFDSGLTTNSGTWTVSYGPGTSTEVTIVMNEGGNVDTNTAWDYTVTSTRADFNYLTFTENTDSTLTPIKFAMPPFTNPNYIGEDSALAQQSYYLPEDSLSRLTGERAEGLDPRCL